MRSGRTDRRNDTFADACQHGIFTGSTDQLFDIGPHSHTRLGNKLNPVLGNGCHGGSIDHFRINGHLNSLGHITTGQIDSGSHLEIECDIGFLRRNQRSYHIRHIPAREKVGFEIIGLQMQTGLRPGDQLIHDHRRRHLAETHQHQLQQADPYAGHQCREPQPDRNEIENKPQ